MQPPIRIALKCECWNLNSIKPEFAQIAVGKAGTKKTTQSSKNANHIQEGDCPVRVEPEDIDVVEIEHILNSISWEIGFDKTHCSARSNWAKTPWA